VNGVVWIMGLLASPVAAGDGADLVLRGGRVWAGKDRPGGTALAVGGERVVAVGSDDSVRGLIGAHTRIVELGGRLVVPGFNDAHVHFMAGGFGLLSVDLRDATDEAELTRRIGAHTRRLPKGTWILNGNWDHERWPSRREPTRALLDAVTPDHPVEAVGALKDLGVRPVMLTGDNRQTAERIAAELGIEEVLAEVLPADKAAKVAELQGQGRKVAMVGDGVNDAPALAQADVGIAIGAGTDVAIETADLVLMRSDPLDVATAVSIGRGTLRKMRQNLGWAIGYNSLALPIAAGVFEPWGLTLRPEIAAISMSGSSVLVAVNALALKRLRLPKTS